VGGGYDRRVAVVCCVGSCPSTFGRPAWTGWTRNSDGQTPWEAAEVAAHAMLLNICQRFGHELTGGPAASIPRADPAAAEWNHADGCALVRGKGEQAESSSPTMSAMIAVLKLFGQREDTYAQVMLAVRQTQDMQQKAEKHAHKFRKQARLLEQAQKDRNDWEGIAEYCRQQWVKAIRERDHKQDQMSQLARERETVQERLVQVTCERDTALRVSENRRWAWEMHRIQSLEWENYLQDQIEAGLVEIHRLNNLLHPIPRPVPMYPEEGAQVIVADDDGMEVDGPAAATPPLHEDVEDEELEPVSDEDGEAIFDADSDDEPGVY